MDKRYQVFVSSTYTDLKVERKSVIETLLNAKYIPAGMEMFSASNDEQFKYIKKIIDDCDYYVLIIGARYGTINSNSGISFTEQEYDYAISKKIPVLVFLHDNPYDLPHEKRDDENRDLLEKFRNKASKNRLCKYWNSTLDLVSNIIISLVDESSDNPQLGWIRGGKYDSTELLMQINELRTENDNLKGKLKEYESEFHYDTDKLDPLHYKYAIVGQQMIGDDLEFSDFRKTYTWDDMFNLISPHLYHGLFYDEYKAKFIEVINDKYHEQIQSIDDHCMQTVKIQFMAWGFILVDIRNDERNKKSDFIKLTDKGKEQLFRRNTNR